MGVEVRPLGVNCNLACQYCYQNPQRDAGNLTRRYDLAAIKAAILAERQPFVVFGGEPLLMAEEDLEELWRFGLQHFGHNGVQTNGLLISDNHLRMFREYKVRVGISIDGPGALNDVRWHGSLPATRAATEKLEGVIARLCREGLSPRLIVTLHRNNATADKLPVMHEWMRQLDAQGIKSVRLHLLEVDSTDIRDKYALSERENTEALRSFATLEPELVGLRFDVFSELDALLLGRDPHATCVWRACDPYTTDAVRGIEGNGQRTNCGRTNKDGIDFQKADRRGYERYLALYQTPQEYGGCQGCRFFLMCKGQCPGTAIDGDWRNRTEHCEVWKELFSYGEERLLGIGQTPLSVHKSRVPLEHAMLDHWARGQNPSLHQLLQSLQAAGQVESQQRAASPAILGTAEPTCPQEAA
jgi:uncharacterized protein